MLLRSAIDPEQTLSKQGGGMCRWLLLVGAGGALLAATSNSVAQNASLMRKYVGEEALTAAQTDPCYKENMGAISAVSWRDHGNTKQDLVDALRSHGLTEENRPVTYSVVNDVYEFPSVQSETYVAYRTLICHAQLHGKPVPKSFSSVASGVLACQKQFEGSDQLFDCVITAVFQDAAR